MENGPTLTELANRLQSLYRLPPMPAIAVRVMQLTMDEDTSAHDLAVLIEHDPSLAAQILRYARSALFNYQGEIRSVQEAITRVLGFDRVSHLALGIAASRAFRLPNHGPLGLQDFWRHSLHCARLSREILRTMPKARRSELDPELAYLCGLLHNLGLLLIGHLFPDDFLRLRELRAADPARALSELEDEVFTRRDPEKDLKVGHAVAGSILLKLWDMPEAVIQSAGLHESTDKQAASVYVQAVQLANALLMESGIGDEQVSRDPEPLARRLGLGADELVDFRKGIQSVDRELEGLANSLAR